MSAPLLSIRDLKVAFKTQGGLKEVLHGVDLEIFPGETVAIVGESGSGKSTTASAIIRLLPGTGQVTNGSISLDGRELTEISARQMEKVRGREIGYVPQDPMSNLNPVWSIGFQVKEAIRANGIASGRKDVERRAIEVLQQAGLADAAKRLHQYPHQFSGGMRQRALIGIGLAADPKLLIADEPTSALDVTVQRVILDHMETLTREKGTSVLLITHDLGLAAERASRVVVMKDGEIVEAGPSRTILENPHHPYTQRLVASAPSVASQRITSVAERESIQLAGVVETEDVPAQVQVLEPVAVSTEIEADAPDADYAVKVETVVKEYKIRMGGFKSEPFRAVDGVSFAIPRGKTLALVGESGSGKSTVAKMLLMLEDPTSGSILIDGNDIGDISKKDAFILRRRMQPVFQDPYGSLDPLRNIENTIAEPLNIHKVGDRTTRRARVRELLEQVSLPSRACNSLSERIVRWPAAARCHRQGPRAQARHRRARRSGVRAGCARAGSDPAASRRAAARARPDLLVHHPRPCGGSRRRRPRLRDGARQGRGDGDRRQHLRESARGVHHPSAQRHPGYGHAAEQRALNVKPSIYRGSTGLIGLVIAVVLAVWLFVDAVIRAGWASALLLAPWILLIVWLVYVLMYASFIAIDARGVTVQNLLRVVRIPWARVADVTMRYQVVFVLDDGDTGEGLRGPGRRPPGETGSRGAILPMSGASHPRCVTSK